MASIFLSYARDDLRKAEGIAQMLGEAGHAVWWDRHLSAGTRFSAEIAGQLEKADLVVVLWSRHSVESPWVQDEAGVGRDSGRLLPVQLEPVLPPLGFRQYHALDLGGRKVRNKQARAKALHQAVEDKLSGKAITPPPAKRYLLAWVRRPRAIAAAALLLMLIVAALFVFRAGRAEAEPASLAVLPFKNLSAGDPYFAEGVAEEIMNKLAREPQFEVTGRTSSAVFKDAADLREVGRRLHVTYVLEGSVRSAANQVRVDVSLVDTRSNRRIWSQNFKGRLDDIFKIQESIGQQVAAHVKRQIVAKGSSKALVTSGEVYRLYVTARSLMRQREPSNIDKSIRLLRQAVAIDPGYAPAWSRLALALNLWEWYGTGGASNQAERIRYAERAIALAPQYGDSHAVLGLLLTSAEDLNAAQMRRSREELEKAVKLHPGDSESWYWLHYLRLRELDFDGGLAALRRSASIDPFFVLNLHYPNLARDMGYRDEAIRFMSDRIANHPDPFVREMTRGYLAGMKNDFSGNYLHARKAQEIAPPDVRSVAEGTMGSILLQLWLLEEAKKFVPKEIIDLRRGKLDSGQTNVLDFPRAVDFWVAQEEPRLFPKVLVKLGRTRDIVRDYDEAFSSPAEMASRLAKPAFINLAPLLAISLQKSGRTREGTKILLLADRMCPVETRTASAPMSVRISCSRLWSVLGRKEQAIRTLEKLVEEGWRPSESDYPRVTDEPAYAVLRNEPRMKRIDAIIGADFARERRELLAAGV